MLWEIIDKKMQEKGWSIYRLAENADIRTSMLYNLRDGRTKDFQFQTMVKIAKAFDCSLDEFIN